MGDPTEANLPFEETSLVVAEHSLVSTADQHRACFDEREFGDHNVLRVTYADGPVELFDWEREFGARPYFGRILLAIPPETAGETDPPRDDVGGVLSNRDLSRLGATLTKVVESMSNANDRPIHVCFEGVGTMLDVVGESNTFQFLRLTIEMIDTTGGCGGHFHLDVSGTTAEERITIEQLFEVVTDLERRHDRAAGTAGGHSEVDR